jgi:hypothetical protein
MCGFTQIVREQVVVTEAEGSSGICLEEVMEEYKQASASDNQAPRRLQT